MRVRPKRIDLSVSGGPEGSQPGGGRGKTENRKHRGGTGAQGPRRVRVEVQKQKKMNICNFLEGMWLHLGVTVEVDQQRKYSSTYGQKLAIMELLLYF